MEIMPERAAIRSSEGDGEYPIKSQTSSGEGKVTLLLDIPEADEEMQWEITGIGDRFLVFGGPEEDEMSGFVWERV